MIAISLQSGSNGNCIYVETEGVKLLFDAGISGVTAERRLAAFGRDIREVDAVVISHDHIDHVRYAGIYQRKFGLPLYVTPKTLSSAEETHVLGKLSNVHLFLSGGSFRLGNVIVQTLSTPHDGADGSIFIVTAREKRLGIMTDLGHVFEGLDDVISSLDAVFIESNYDKEMLLSGPYPAFLKRRIQGEGGHISNVEAAGLLCGAKRLKWACLAHLSEKNNDPDLALRTHRSILNREMRLHIASRYRPTGILSL